MIFLEMMMVVVVVVMVMVVMVVVLMMILLIEIYLCYLQKTLVSAKTCLKTDFYQDVVGKIVNSEVKCQ